MEAVFLFLLFIFVLVIFIILLSFKSTSSFGQRMIMKRVEELKNEILELKSSGVKIQPAAKETVIKHDVLLSEEKKIEKEEKIPEKKIVVQEVEPELIEKLKNEEPLISEQSTKTVYKEPIVQEKVKQITQPKKKTDFEKFIGENLLNKIGMIILVLALIFFGKYAVDKGWLNDTAKVVAIILIGGVLIGIAHRLRKDYKAFSSVLAGGGIAALYISIAVGFQLYNLFSQTSAFLILVVITILAVMLSLAYDKKELAIIAILGGFITPILVSTGQGNYKVLFTYILILDIGMLVLAYYKKWNLVNFVANFATLILYALWLVDAHFEKNNLPHIGALIFVSAFYLVFFLMNIINNVKEQNKFTAFEFLMLITNSFLYFWAGMFIINDYQPDYLGLFTVALAVFNFAFAFPLYRNKQIDKNLIFLLIGLVLTFVSIAIPVQFKGKYITMFWAAESVLLLWLSQKSGIRLMKIASFAVTFLMIISLIMDWNQIYINRPFDAPVMKILINEGFITGMVVIIALLFNLRLLKMDEQFSAIKNMSSAAFSNFFIIFLIISLYITLQLELVYQVDSYYNDSYLTAVAIAFYNYLYIAAVLVWAVAKELKYILHGIVIIGLLSILVYVMGVAPEYRNVIDYYLMDEIKNNFSILHFLTAALALIVCYYSWLGTVKIFKGQTGVKNIMLWFSIIIGVGILSMELDYMVLLANSPQTNDAYLLVKQTHLIGWPILWGSLAFILMFLGIRKDEKMLRIIGMSLFFFALLKLFIKDVWDMPEGGRIAAFISLGVLLLVISFMYQKLKKILFDSENENEKIEENIEQ